MKFYKITLQVAEEAQSPHEAAEQIKLYLNNTKYLNIQVTDRQTGVTTYHEVLN